jgi:hypothetical protein
MTDTKVLIKILRKLNEDINILAKEKASFYSDFFTLKME